MYTLTEVNQRRTWSVYIWATAYQVRRCLASVMIYINEQNKNLRVIYCSVHLAMAQGLGWVAQQTLTLTSYVMTQKAFLMIFRP